MEDAKVAGRRWSVARSRADFAFPRKDVRSKIDAVSKAVGVYEEAFTKITPSGDLAGLTDSPYGIARAEAHRHVDELREQLLAMKL